MTKKLPILYGYWRSGASYRVRIALGLKNIKYEYRAVNLLNNEQKSDDYLQKNPIGLVPTLLINDLQLTNSMAIIQYLDDIFPKEPLQFSDPGENAHLCAYCQAIFADTQPLGNFSVINYLKTNFYATQDQALAFAKNWIERCFDGLEDITASKGGPFAFGPKITMADIFLVPQIYTAQRYDVDLSKYPHLMDAAKHANDLPEFRAAHPNKQPDAKN